MKNEEELSEEILKILSENKLEDMEIKVVYKNHRGEEAIRHILPIRIFYGSTEFHREKQWLMEVYDLDKKAKRDYALKDFKSFVND